jgi:hypothetical protein
LGNWNPDVVGRRSYVDDRHKSTLFSNRSNAPRLTIITYVMVAVACPRMVLSVTNFLSQLCGYVPPLRYFDNGSYAVTVSGTFILIDGIITATCCVTVTLAQAYCITVVLVDTVFGLLAAFAFTENGRVTISNMLN